MLLRASWIWLFALFVPVRAWAWSADALCALPLAGPPPDTCEEASLPHVLQPAMDDLCASMSGRDSPEEAYAVARRALDRARAFEAQGNYDRALLHLRVAEASLPRLADYFANLRAELHLRARDPAQAARAFRDVVSAHMNLDLAARAHVQLVEALLAADDEHAEQELGALLQRYPKLPEAPVLKLALARHREEQGALRTALATYRALDLALPGYPVAREARLGIARLAEKGLSSAPYTPKEQLARLALLVRSGPVELARSELLGAAATLKLTNAQKAELAALAARLDEVDASSRPAVTELEVTLDPEDRARRTASLLGKKPLDKMKPFQLTLLLDLAAREGLREAADSVVRALNKKQRSAVPEALFDALVTGSGTASDEALIELASAIVEHPRFGVAALYHRGRAYERRGQSAEARADFARVIREDDSATHFYANWADQRLRVLAGERPNSACSQGSLACADERVLSTLGALEKILEPDVAGALARLEPVIARHGAAFPWLERARDALKVGRHDWARDELYETFLAYRSSLGAKGMRAGLTAVYRGTAVVRPITDLNQRRARQALDSESRHALADVASILGDDGTAALFGGPSYAERHPRPYPIEVARAARQHGLDPDLLFAVMRVESVYQRRIISHAGAIGLMQIMPRTGRLIADRLGQYDKTTSDLLEPATNLDYAAWYLSSLLERMDGHLPLAIASYNGGPHNVRKWMRRFGTQLPLDAFLEKIPFTETKRYVRRVLGYYARYKAESGQKLILMDVTLPRDVPSEVSF